MERSSGPGLLTGDMAVYDEGQSKHGRSFAGGKGQHWGAPAFRGSDLPRPRSCWSATLRHSRLNFKNSCIGSAAIVVCGEAPLTLSAARESRLRVSVIKLAKAVDLYYRTRWIQSEAFHVRYTHYTARARTTPPHVRSVLIQTDGSHDSRMILFIHTQ